MQFLMPRSQLGLGFFALMKIVSTREVKKGELFVTLRDNMLTYW